MKKITLFAMLVVALSACQETLEERAEREATDYTEKNCPLTMNEFQVLDSFTFDRLSHTFGYHYRLTGKMDTTEAILPDQQRKALVDGIRNATILKAYKDEGYSFRYVYRSEKQPDQILYETTITNTDYK